MEIGFRPAFGIEFDIAVADRFDCGLGEFAHLDEPLFAEHGFDRHAAALGVADRVGEVFDFLKESLRFELFNDELARLETVHAFELFSGFGVEMSGLVHDIDELKIMAETDLEVVRVVGGSDLHAAGALFRIGMFVADDRDFAVGERKVNGLADKVLVARIFRIDRHRGVAEHGFRTGRGDHEITGTVGQRIAEVIEFAGLVLVDHLFIGECGLGNGTPVDHAASAVDVTFVVELNENFADGTAESLVHGETFALPVAGGAEFAELADNGSAVFGLPFPDTLDELVASEIVASDVFGLAEFFCHAGFGCNSGVVGSGEPAALIAFHAVPAHENVLKRVVEDMSHGEDARHVRRGDDDGIGFLIRIRFPAEESVVLPPGIPFLFNFRRLVCFRHFLTGHTASCIFLNYNCILKIIYTHLAELHGPFFIF